MKKSAGCVIVLEGGNVLPLIDWAILRSLRSLSSCQCLSMVFCVLLVSISVLWSTFFYFLF